MKYSPSLWWWDGRTQQLAPGGKAGEVPSPIQDLLRRAVTKTVDNSSLTVVTRFRNATLVRGHGRAFLVVLLYFPALPSSAALAFVSKRLLARPLSSALVAAGVRDSRHVDDARYIPSAMVVSSVDEGVVLVASQGTFSFEGTSASANATSLTQCGRSGMLKGVWNNSARGDAWWYSPDAAVSLIPVSAVSLGATAIVGVEVELATCRRADVMFVVRSFEFVAVTIVSLSCRVEAQVISASTRLVKVSGASATYNPSTLYAFDDVDGSCTTFATQMPSSTSRGAVSAGCGYAMILNVTQGAATSVTAVDGSITVVGAGLLLMHLQMLDLLRVCPAVSAFVVVSLTAASSACMPGPSPCSGHGLCTAEGVCACFDDSSVGHWTTGATSAPCAACVRPLLAQQWVHNSVFAL